MTKSIKCIARFFGFQQCWRFGLMLMGAGLLVVGCGKLGLQESFQKIQQQQRAEVLEKAKYFSGLTDDLPIAYIGMEQAHAQIFMMQADGTGMVQRTHDPGYKARPAWSLDHKLLAYFQFASDRPIGDTVSIMLLDAAGNTREVLHDKKVDMTTAHMGWSPDGRILYLPEKDFPTVITGYDVTTGQPVESLRLPKKTFLTRIYTLSRDGKSLAGDGPTKEHVMHPGTVPRDGGRELDLLMLFSKGAVHYGPPVWSYDSQLVAFEIDTTVVVMSSSFRLDFKVFPLSPSDFDAKMSGPTFSPSGRQMVCVMEKSREGTMGAGDEEVTTDLWIMEINGTKQRPLTKSGTCFDPAW